MKKHILSAVCLFACCALFSQEKSKFFADVQVKPKIKIEKCLAENIYSSECLDSCSGIDRNSTECIEYYKKFWAWEHEVNKEYYTRLEEQVRLEQQQKRVEQVTASAIVIIFLLAVGGPFFFFLKKRFSRGRKKINLWRKQRIGKHTLDDVFALEDNGDKK